MPQPTAQPTSQRQEAAAASAMPSGQGKRLELGKRKLAELEAQMRVRARSAASAFEVPTDADLALVEATPSPICFTWLYADGSSSVSRLGLVRKDEVFDPANEALPIGVSLLIASEYDSVCFHWRLPSRLGDDTHAAPASDVYAERAWRLLRAMLCGGRGAFPALIAPNAKQVIRSLALCCGKSSASPRGGYQEGVPMWDGLDRWMDPIMIGWLLEPDAPEADLLLPQLERRYLGEGGEGGGKDRLGSRVVENTMRRELRIVEALASMELIGLPLDTTHLTRHSEAISTRLDELARKAEAVLHAPLNLASPQQCSEALYVQLQLPRPKQADAAAKATHGSTGEAQLAELARKFPTQPLPAIILEHRELSKLITAFIAPYSKRVRGGGGGDRLFTEWHTHTTGTGRLSSRHPNVQQVPKRPTALREGGGEVVNVRDAFRLAPSSGRLLLSADYSQLEMRLIAFLSKDQKLAAQMHAGGDLFTNLTSVWRRKARSDVTPTEREQTKQMSYGLIYGLGAERLAGSLQTTIADARTLKNGFVSCFAELHHFTENCKSYAKQARAVRTCTGRLRPLPHIASTHSHEKAKAERQAVNTVVQGSAADLMKHAMLRVVEELHAARLDARLIAQLHDEVLLELDEAQLGDVAAVVYAAMEHVELDGVRLPHMPVSVSCGRSWGQMQPVPRPERLGGPH